MNNIYFFPPKDTLVNQIDSLIFENDFLSAPEKRTINVIADFFANSVKTFEIIKSDMVKVLSRDDEYNSYIGMIFIKAFEVYADPNVLADEASVLTLTDSSPPQDKTTETLPYPGEPQRYSGNYKLDWFKVDIKLQDKALFEDIFLVYDSLVIFVKFNKENKEKIENYLKFYSVEGDFDARSASFDGENAKLFLKLWTENNLFKEGELDKANRVFA